MPRAQDRVAELQSKGFEVHVCVGAIAMQQTLQAVFKAEHPAVLVLLDGDLRGNCADAQLINTLYPECGVVSLLDDLGEEALINALQSGADTCCGRYASVNLLASILFSLLRRRGGAAYVPKASASQSDAWQLARQAWVLQGPENCALSLTTAERAFLMRLTQQPGMRATHEELMQAIDPESDAITMRAAQARLGVLVSRLRRKLRQKYDLELPVKSLHKWGYMFTGDMRS